MPKLLSKNFLKEILVIRFRSRDDTMHSGATPLLRGCSRKNIFCQKVFDNFFSFQATEMVLTSKWGRIQPEIQI